MSCCVCASVLSSAKGWKKRKNLYSDGCKAEKETITKCMEELCGVTIDSVGFSQESTVCYECCVKLNKIKKFEKDIETLKTDIIRKFLPADLGVSATDASSSQSQPSLRSRKHADPSIRSTSQSAVPENDDYDNDNGPDTKRHRVIVRFLSWSL